MPSFEANRLKRIVRKLDNVIIFARKLQLESFKNFLKFQYFFDLFKECTKLIYVIIRK